MLLSMTGFGEASHQGNSLAVGVEVRAINSRYFKLSVRSPEGYATLETQVEGVVRQKIKRGTIQVQLRADRAQAPDAFAINMQVLEGYRRQLGTLEDVGPQVERVRLEAMLMLPGVVQDNSAVHVDTAAEWPIIQAALEGALDELIRMRADEGAAMAEDLTEQCHAIRKKLDDIETLAPMVIDGYRDRLAERVNKALEEFHVRVDHTDLIREVSLFADRCDISEEIVRLRSHVVQFQEIMNLSESSGRKLEFLTQEMFREANTIGSKANHVEIARHAVDVKASIERIREQVQNIE